MIKLNRRQQLIIDELDEHNFTKVNELCEKLNVSAVTIRKDLQYLENTGLLYRTHGGASKQPLYAFEKNINEKEFVQVMQKQKIAKAALKFVNDQDFIILASGTTVYYLAKIISGYEKLTIITSSLSVSMELSKDSFIDVIQLGGNLRKSSISVIGSLAESELKKFSCNKLFLGIDGIDLDFGLSTSNSTEAHLNKVMIEQSEKVIVLADSTKINKRGFGQICSLDKVDVLITDNDITEKDLTTLEDNGIEVIVAK
ncbi:MULTISPECIES: DeoR/GlpR family DNA-binding transcription regulator [Apibacter]|uniref:DeoR/GlpR family DNA-binding transcription regulator n=1 Tax=Apibacter TaxID=1778601 RepID=UPI000CF99090|nr:MULTISPECIES: DeoR/GlpR family DNA-binding transcription regulator [Apibacter]MCX8677812.1 DeoR/GlpR transcriptional regulator [Apibacter sp. B3919]MXO25088.1 DeoR family transcriptional regulator [Apibacter sp. B3924]MXO27161.1 DeoR family transcriptional regulator [Apibacter sp. B3813]MXO28974.1 DeoR family transcriptional regulator [Apibacter sp. B3913]MXO31245.1 DeoR family transcriptional regulator [Apibacter sp. B3912]